MFGAEPWRRTAVHNDLLTPRGLLIDDACRSPQVSPKTPLGIAQRRARARCYDIDGGRGECRAHEVVSWMGGRRAGRHICPLNGLKQSRWVGTAGD